MSRVLILVPGYGAPGVAAASAETVEAAELAARTLLEDRDGGPTSGHAARDAYSIIGPIPGDPSDPTFPARWSS